MNYNKLIIVLLVFELLSSCNTKKIDFKKNDNLLYFKTSLAYTIDELVDTNKYMLEAIGSDTFNTKTDTILYLNNCIYISFLSLVNECTSYDGDIEFKSDSIYLKLIDTVGVSCTGQSCDRLVYKIKNIGNKKYKIKKI